MKGLVMVYLFVLGVVLGAIVAIIYVDAEYAKRPPQVVTKIVVERVEVEHPCPMMRTEGEVKAPVSPPRPHQYLERP